MPPLTAAAAQQASTQRKWRRGRTSFFFQAEDGIRDGRVTGVQTCALPILREVIEGTKNETRWSLPVSSVSTDIAVSSVTSVIASPKSASGDSADRTDSDAGRSEERRVGKEGRTRRSARPEKNKSTLVGSRA